MAGAGYVELKNGSIIRMEVVADLLLMQGDICEADARKFAHATGTDIGFWMGMAGSLEVLALLGPFARVQARKERKCAEK